MSLTCHQVKERIYLLSWKCRRQYTTSDYSLTIEESGKTCLLNCSYKSNSLTLRITNQTQSDGQSQVIPATGVSATFDGVFGPMKFNHPDWKAPFQLEHSYYDSYVIVGFVIDFNTLPTMAKGSQRVIDQLSDLWKTKSLSDITFKFKSTTIAAHSQIIASGSPILAAMFQSNFREATDRVAFIKEVKPEVFEKLLCFIYTGDAAIDEGTVRDLLVAADMYGVDLLKEECAIHMSQKLTVANACKNLVLAHLHNVPSLYESTLDFIATNPQQICTRNDWLDLIKKYPQLSFEAVKRISAKCTLKK